MSQSLSSLLDQVLSTQKSVNLNLEEIPNATRAGFSMRQQQAKGDLPGLLTKLQKDLVPGRLVGVIAYGDAEAIKVAQAFLIENRGIVLDANRLYTDAARKIEPTYSTDRLFRTNQQMGVILKCEEFSKDLGLGPNVDLEFSEAYCHTFDASVEHCRKVIRAGVSDRLNLALLARQAVDQALTGHLDDEKIPVLLIGSTEDERSSMRSLFVKSVAHTFQAMTPDSPPIKDQLISVLKTAS